MGTISLCPVLQNLNRSLQVLELSGNHISDKGMAAFGEMLQYNVYLKKVWDARLPEQAGAKQSLPRRLRQVVCRILFPEEIVTCLLC